MSKPVKLNPCPFDGGKAKFFDEKEGGWLSCDKCGANSSYCYSSTTKSALEFATEDWNRRTKSSRTPRREAGGRKRK